MQAEQYLNASTVLFRGNCAVTGKPHSIASTCSLAHARSLLAVAKRNGLTLSDVAIMAGMRYAQAQRLREKRYKLQAAKREIAEIVHAGFIPSVSQLVRAGIKIQPAQA